MRGKLHYPHFITEKIEPQKGLEWLPIVPGLREADLNQCCLSPH